MYSSISRPVVLLPGNGPEAHAFDEHAQGAVLERHELRSAVHRLAQAGDLGIADRMPKRLQVVQQSGGIGGDERGGTVGDPTGHRRPGRSARTGRGRGGDHDRASQRGRPGLGIEAEVVVSTAQDLDERMPPTDDFGGADAFEAVHRSRSGLQPV
jgi:hypothetical protein